MFKETLGFDIDKLQRGVAVVIDDTGSTLKNGRMIALDRLEDFNYYLDNKSGTYIINESSSTMLRLMSINGTLTMFPIKHFIGDNPRMTVKIYG